MIGIEDSEVIITNKEDAYKYLCHVFVIIDEFLKSSFLIQHLLDKKLVVKKYLIRNSAHYYLEKGEAYKTEDFDLIKKELESIYNKIRKILNEI